MFRSIRTDNTNNMAHNQAKQRNTSMSLFTRIFLRIRVATAKKQIKQPNIVDRTIKRIEVGAILKFDIYFANFCFDDIVKIIFFQFRAFVYPDASAFVELYSVLSCTWSAVTSLERSVSLKSVSLTTKRRCC